MENSDPKPGRTRRFVLVLALVASIVFAIVCFLYGLIRQIEADNNYVIMVKTIEQCRQLSNEAENLRAELDSCSNEAAVAFAHAAAALAEAEKIRKQNK